MSGGNNRARTCDPLLVRQMLSQLSYAPVADNFYIISYLFRKVNYFFKLFYLFSFFLQNVLFCSRNAYSKCHILGCAHRKPPVHAVPNGDKNHWIPPAAKLPRRSFSTFNGTLLSVNPSLLVMRMPVGIRYHCRFVENIAHNQVGCFSTNTRQLC